MSDDPRSDTTDRTRGGRHPLEPAGPPPAVHTFRRRWFTGWLVVGGLLLVAFIGLWILDATTLVLGLVGASAGLAASIALHHLVATSDLGERAVPRPGPVDEVAPLRGRRRLLGGALGAVALVAVGGVSALLRFGRREPPRSAWSAGDLLTTLDGTPVRPEDLPLGSVVTVWPESARGEELSAVMLLRLREVPQPPTELGGVVDETLVAYSRLCTHAGCAVALYRDRDQALFCPCHQATFAADRGAIPVSGPASHPLPQLPLGIDDEGFVIATGQLTAPPGAVGGTV